MEDQSGPNRFLRSLPSWIKAVGGAALLRLLSRLFSMLNLNIGLNAWLDDTTASFPSKVSHAEPPAKASPAPHAPPQQQQQQQQQQSAPPPPVQAPPPSPAPPPPPVARAPGLPNFGASSGAGDSGNLTRSDKYDATLVRVFYATDRLRVSDKPNHAAYDGQRSQDGKLDYGECHVSIPDTHATGQLESPSWLKFEFRPDPNKHIVLDTVTTIEEDTFFDKVSQSVLRSAKKDAFVFVHGYNVTFEDAARRAGQFAYDLKFVGAPIFYSWPSNGKLADYTRDENNITWTVPHLQRFLTLLSQRSGAERIHVIAHSMGNRAVCEALRLLSYDSTNQLQLTHLVLAAADIDASTFADLAQLLRKLSAKITLYESSNDKALLASKKIHGYTRAGEPLLVLAGLDTIDASAIDTDFLGHSYFSSDYALLSDIHTMLSNDEPPDDRIGLSLKQSPTGPYYEFRPR